MSDPTDEFGWIDSLRGLTGGDPRAMGLLDDAAVIAGRPGYELVISKDAMVEGVHFAAGESADIIARRLLRTSLSDLAAKAAEPFGYLLTTALPDSADASWRTRFRAGLTADGETFGIVLLGGDTVWTPGPLTLEATVLGWAKRGRTVLRSGAKPGDALIVCGAIGDGWLGLMATRGLVPDPAGALARHYRLPEPLFILRETLARFAHAAADVSDGLLADAGHLARASSMGLTIDIEAFPVSPAAQAWLSTQPVTQEARLRLASGGDDYAIVCAVAARAEASFLAKVRSLGIDTARAGWFDAGFQGLRVLGPNGPITPSRTGWRHGPLSPS